MSSSYLRSAFVALVPCVLQAQEPEPRDSIAAADTIRAAELPPLFVTASRVPLAAGRLGFGSSAVSRQQLRAEPVPFAADALVWVPGISIDEPVGPGGPASIRLRGGEEPFTQAMFDGIAINLTGGFLDLQGLTLTNVERVEVARGPQSALFGSSAVSGAVQFITRQGRVGAPQIDWLTEGGGATEHGGRARSALAVGGGSSGFRYSGGVGVTYARGIYAVAHDLKTRDVSVRFDANPDRAWALVGTLRYIDIDAQLPVRDPGVTRAPLDPNARDGTARLLGSVEARFQASPAWEQRLSASVYRNTFHFEDEQDRLDPAAFPFFVFDFNFQFESELWRPTVEYIGTHRVSLAGGQSALAVSYGGTVQWERESTVQGGDFGDDAAEFDRGNRALVGEIQGRVGSTLSFLAGARAEKYEGLPTRLVPRASAVVTLVPGALSLRAAVGRGYKAPNLQQQFLVNPFVEANPDLEPETSVSWEVGIGAGDARSLSANAAFFWQRYDNLIRTVNVEGTTRQTNRNLGVTRAIGVEVDLERQWSRGLRSGGNLTWVKTEVIDNAGLPSDQFPEGSPLTGVPAVTGNVWTEARLAPWVSAVVRGRVVGEQVVFTERFRGERVEVDPYFLADLTLHLAPWRQVGGYVRIVNLFDASYETAFDRPGVPLTGVVGVRVGT